MIFRIKLKDIRQLWILCSIILLSNSCQKENNELILRSSLSIPKGLSQPNFPADNPYSEEAFLLGRHLFYDKKMSRDFSIACASCHKPQFAFSDTIPLSPGSFGRPGMRNAPTLTNVAYQPYFLKEGSLSTLEKQVLVPIQEHNEFDMDMPLIVKRLESDSGLQELAMKAYHRPIDAFVITRSISTFERTIISGESRYDKSLSGYVFLTPLEQKGLQLFQSERLQCTSCHSGIQFTNYSFENNGLYAIYADIGRMRFTGDDKDLGKFKVPTLRNIAITAPYMHDGSLPDLEAVIEHYNKGGMNHPNKSNKIKPLSLNDSEKEALKAFLQSLTDEDFLIDTKYYEQ